MKQNLKQDGLTVKGWFKIDHFDRFGNLMETIETPNAMTEDSFEEISGLINSDTAGSYTAFNYIAVGSGTATATATDTQLQTEETENGLTRTTGTGSQVTTTTANDTAQLLKSFSVTGSVTVTESGVFVADSGGTMICRQTFSEINVADGDTLQITWKVKIAAAA